MNVGTAHGCIICSSCHQACPICGTCGCPKMPSYIYQDTDTYTPITTVREYGIKCDICGSTAIDHTENQCSINRLLKPKKIGRKK